MLKFRVLSQKLNSGSQFKNFKGTIIPIMNPTDNDVTLGFAV
ncbi:unnamed protein product, partial [marine sediment metagenome]